MITLDDVETARRRLLGHVRVTPVMELTLGRTPLRPAVAKLELNQVTGSFKARGAMNRLLALPGGQAERGIVAASGGNHGLAVARAAHVAGQVARIYVPDGVSPVKAAAMRSWGAEVIPSGPTFAEADTAARADVERSGATYFHPFADADIMAGQGTLALELMDQAEFDTVLVAIGGGGLVSGMATALKALRPQVRIIGVEPEGAPTLHACLVAGRRVRLPSITTSVPTLAAPETTEDVWRIAGPALSDVLLIDDDDMRRACGLLWRDYGIAADLAGAAAAAALLRHADRLRDAGRIAILICGSGPEGLSLADGDRS